MRTFTTPIPRLAIALTALAAAGCDREPESWNAAEAADDAAAYETYLAEYPNGAHAEEAEQRREASAWTAARAENTSDAYAAYLDAHTNGAHAEEARVRAAGLGFALVNVSMAVNTPPGTFFQTPLFGPVESYPEGTTLSLELRGPLDGETILATVEATYVGIEDEHGRFENDNGVCLYLGPYASTVEPCPDDAPTLPAADDLPGVLLYTWRTDF